MSRTLDSFWDGRAGMIARSLSLLIMALSILWPVHEAMGQSIRSLPGGITQQEIEDQLRQLREREEIQPPLDREREEGEQKEGELEEVVTPAPALEQSKVEVSYSRRMDLEIEQFGYKAFREEAKQEAPLTGALPDSYVLGIGDDLVITFRGNISDSLVRRVDSEGRVIVPELPPIPAAGRTLGDLRRDLEARVEATLLNTDVFVSIGSIRLISVFVIGEVAKPGLHRLTSLSTVLDALVAAGGIDKSGSLRRVQVNRHGLRFWIDLYDLLLAGGFDRELTLVEGDQIFVPTLGATAAIAGEVKRPAIYELAEGRTQTTLAELLRMSGGLIVPEGNRIILVSNEPSGRSRIVESGKLDETIVRDGEFVLVRAVEGLQTNEVRLVGHVHTQGIRSLANVPTVRSLLPDMEIFKRDPYLFFAVLRRTDPRARLTTLTPLDLHGVLNGNTDVRLADHDVLIVLSLEDVSYLRSPAIQGVISGVIGRVALAGEACQGLRVIASVIDSERKQRYDRSRYFSRSLIRLDEAAMQQHASACPDIFDAYPNLLPLLLEHAVVVAGEVRRPGVYPVLANTTLASLVSIAGGFSVGADVSMVELSRPAGGGDGTEQRIERYTLNLQQTDMRTVALAPGDFVRFNPIPADRDSGPVILEGEFVRPGIYDIRRGELLSQVIARAGGFTAQAYPYGAVFTRQRVKEEERKGFRRVARELNATIANRIVNEDIDARELEALRQLSLELQTIEALGRVVIEADPAVLQVRPDLDTVLEPGDRLVVPKRPNFVTVVGDVLNPGSLQFAPAKRTDEYIDQAGGFQRTADEDGVFVVFPNGEAQPVSISAWRTTSVHIPPGSAIVVPKHPSPLNLQQLTIDVLTILSRLAISAASIAVISTR